MRLIRRLTEPKRNLSFMFQVQDDIRQLRENLATKGDGKTISIEELENALNKTEQGLQVCSSPHSFEGMKVFWIDSSIHVLVCHGSA